MIIEEPQVVDFLLGKLSEIDRVAFEQRVFSDDRFYEQVLAIQDDLTYEYVRDSLSESEQSEFERQTLRSPRRRERVEFFAAFSSALTEFGPKPKTLSIAWWQPLAGFVRQHLTLGASATAIGLMICAVWSTMENRKLHDRIEQVQVEKETVIKRTGDNQAAAEQKQADLEREIAALRTIGGEMKSTINQKERELESLRRSVRASSTPPASSLIATFILSPGLTRGSDEPEKVIIPNDANSIRLQLDLEKEETYQSYVAEIRTARGNLVSSMSGLKMHRTAYGETVSFKVQTGLVATGEYEVTLRGETREKLETVGYYYFIAMKR